MVALVLVSAALSLVTLGFNAAALLVFRGDDGFSSLDVHTREAIGMILIRMHGQANGINQTFWGLWLLPFGWLVALMMEGKFSGEGLQSLDANEDLLSAMARELVEKGGVGETADAVWKDLERERAKQAPAPKPMAEVITLPVIPVEQESVEILPEPVELPAPAGLQLVFPSNSRPKRRSAPLWPTSHTHGEQMRLFG